METKNKIIVSSVNCRGLSINQHPKLINAFDYIKATNSNIICLQETHWTNSNIRELKKYTNNEIIINGEFTNKRGVAILLSNNFEYKILNKICDEESRVLTLDLLIENDFSIRLINIYAPNKDTPTFYNYVQQLYDSSDCTYTVITGDFNLVLDPLKDSYNYMYTNNPKSREIVLNLLSNHDMIDIYRHIYPDKLEYTWKRKKPSKKARLDYFIISSTLTDLIDKTLIIPTIDWTDHAFIQLHIVTNHFNRGKGTWKLNCNLLYNEKYIQLVHETIEKIKLEYAVPIYNKNNIGNIDDNLVKFTISDRLFLEMLLLKIRQETIHFASQCKKSMNKQEKELIIEIQKLENDSSLSQLTDLIQDKKQQLNEIRDTRLKGNFIRSRVQYLKDGEKPTKFFCALENINYVNKTIKKLSINNQIITKQTDILHHIKDFYTNLFSNKDSSLTDINIETLLSQSLNKINKLSEDQKSSIESPIKLDELASTLYKMNNNKTPGNDGFPCEFYKMFWVKLKFFILRSVNETFLDKELMITARQCQITCLPKGDKPREFLKNWRPISLLNVTYKLISATLANRLKQVLPNIISETQTGFLQHRFIGESTRLIYDLMSYAEEHNQKGLLMLIDFEKAFDSVSWHFLYKTLDFLNFGPYIKTWVKILNTNITATVQQSGFNSHFFPVKRGCRQGDPIASYEFLLCAQILYLLIQQNKDIKGLIAHQYEYKLTQFADDTTLIMDGSQGSLQAALNTLEIFGSISGLRINKDKTKIIWIGKKRNSIDILETQPPLQWGSTEFDLLGLTFSTDMSKILELNYKKYLPVITNTIKHWNNRYLTPIGKITIIKTFLMSKLIHLFTSLPTPSDEFIKQVQTQIYQFLWDGKPDKIKRSQLTQQYKKAGLQMLDIKNFIKSLKISWFRRLIENTDNPWIYPFRTTIAPVYSLYELGDLNIISLARNSKNEFWKSALFALKDYLAKVSLEESFNVLNVPLWLNSNISKYPIYLKSWSDKGISTIGDVLDSNYNMLSPEEIFNKYNVNTDFLTQLRLRRVVTSYISNNDILQINNLSYTRPHVPYLVSKLRSKNKNNIYKTLIKDDSFNYFNPKWEVDLGQQIDDQTFSKAFNICFKTVENNYIKWHQYKILTRILGIKSKLCKMKIKDDAICRLCKNHEETLIHLFAKCPKISPLWDNISIWIRNKLNIIINFTDIDIILGYLNNNNFAYPLNTIILVTKSYIFWCCRNQVNPNPLDLQNKIYQCYTEQKQINDLKDKNEKFIKLWNVWKLLF